MTADPDVTLLEIELAGFPGRPVPGDRSWNLLRGGPAVLLGWLEAHHTSQSGTCALSSCFSNPGVAPDRSGADSADTVPVVQAERKSEARWTRS